MKICLNMIVKDEAAIIAANLATYIPHVDYYVICDTGSSDGTIAVIRRVMDHAGIPGEIHQFPFINFEDARNRALDYARHSAASFEYILFADADRTIEASDACWKRQLSHDCYSARVYNQQVSYYVVRLIRKLFPCRWEGVTHEKLKHDGQVKRLLGVVFHELGTGDSRKVKYRRDIALLTTALREQPDNSRYWFYLGQSYFNLGDYPQSADAYGKRVAFGDDSQEVFYSLYRMGLCWERLGRWPEALDCYLRSYQARPGRLEGLYEVARFYRANGKPHLAMLFAERCITAPYPREDGLFIRDRIYNFGIPYEYAAIANQLGQWARAREVCERLMDNASLTDTERKKILDLLRKNEQLNMPSDLLKSHEINREKFDKEYQSGKWSFLGKNLREAPRFGVVAAYIERCCLEGEGVLELGCGEGTLCRYLPERFKSAYVGVDISEVALSNARKNCIGEFHCEAIECYVPSRKFGTIVFGEVLYYISDAEQVTIVNRYRPYLTPEGCIILSTFRSKGKESAIWSQINNMNWKILDRVQVMAPSKNYTWDLGVLKPK